MGDSENNDRFLKAWEGVNVVRMLRKSWVKTHMLFGGLYKHNVIVDVLKERRDDLFISVLLLCCLKEVYPGSTFHGFFK